MNLYWLTIFLAVFTRHATADGKSWFSWWQKTDEKNTQSETKEESTNAENELESWTKEEIELAQAVSMKQLLLLEEFENYWNRRSKVIVNKPEGKVLILHRTDYPLTIKEVMGIVYERIIAIQLNLMTNVCAAFYSMGKKRPEKEKSKKCQEVANFLSWYNKQVSNTFLQAAKEASKTFVAPKIKNKQPTFTLQDIMEQLEELSADLDTVNKSFEEAGSNYKNILKNLETAYQTKQNRNLFDDGDECLTWYSDSVTKTVQTTNSMKKDPLSYQPLLERETSDKNWKNRSFYDKLTVGIWKILGQHILNVQVYSLALAGAYIDLHSSDETSLGREEDIEKDWELIRDKDVSSASDVYSLEYAFVSSMIIGELPEKWRKPWTVKPLNNKISDYEVVITPNVQYNTSPGKNYY